MKITLKTIFMTVLALIMSSCYSEYYFVIDEGKEETEFVKFVDTLGVNFYLENTVWLNYPRLKVKVARNIIPIKVDELSASFSLNDSGCFKVSEFNVFYTGSVNRHTFEKNTLIYGTKKTRIFDNDTIKNPPTDFDNLFYLISYVSYCTIEPDNFKTLIANIRIKAIIAGKDIAIEKKITFNKNKVLLLRR